MWTSQTSRPSLRTRLGSILTTMHWLPKRRAASWTNCGFLTAAELIETLSHPALSSVRMSSSVANAAADGQRHENHLGRAPHHVEHDFALFMAGGDVQKDEFVGPFGLVARRHLDGIAGVAQIQEVDPLHHASGVNVETRNNPLGEHGPVNPSGHNLSGARSKTEPSTRGISTAKRSGRIAGYALVFNVSRRAHGRQRLVRTVRPGFRSVKNAKAAMPTPTTIARLQERNVPMLAPTPSGEP